MYSRAGDELLSRAFLETLLQMTLHIRLELPLSQGQARAHGIQVAVTHLLIQALEGTADDSFLRHAFERLLSGSKMVILVVFGPFNDKNTGSGTGLEFLGRVLGNPAFSVATKDAWHQVSQLRAEWIALIERDPFDMEMLAARLDTKAPRFKLSPVSELGALVAETDIINPLLVYYPQNQSLELFGSMPEILRRFDIIRDLVLGEDNATRRTNVVLD